MREPSKRTKCVEDCFITFENDNGRNSKMQVAKKYVANWNEMKKNGEDISGRILLLVSQIGNKKKKGTFSRNHRPFVVHRLDRDTSGVMMFALTEKAQKKIMDNWKTIVTERLYRAVAENPRNPEDALSDSGLIDDEIAYNAHNIGFVPKKGARPADTPFTRKALLHKRTFSGREERSVYERNLTVKNGQPQFKTASFNHSDNSP